MDGFVERMGPLGVTALLYGGVTATALVTMVILAV